MRATAGRLLTATVIVATLLAWQPDGRSIAAHDQREVAGSSWPQWGGLSRNFVVEDAGLAEKWPEAGPRQYWTRPLGTGHSSIVVDDGRLFTMYRAGNGRSRQGPWDAEETVIALDAATGKTLWEHKYPSRREDFSFGAGPHSTPLVVGDRVFTVGTNQQLFAFDKRTGRVLWSHDFIAEFGSPELLLRPNVKTGYGCSLIAFEGAVICSVGGPGQSVMAFRQSDGAVLWKSGDFLTSAAAPILIELGGQPQVVFLAGGTVMGLDPRNGRILWGHPHDPGNDLNCTTPIWGADNVLFLSSAYKAGSRAIRLRQQGGITHADELWFTNRVRYMFLSAVRVGNFVYGTTGDFGPAFLTALDINTGQAAWQHRGFQRASLVQAGDKTIVMDEDGDLAMARLTPDGATVLAQTRLFETTSWTVPTLVGTTLYARDREKIVALDLSASGTAPIQTGGTVTPPRATGSSTVIVSAKPIAPALYAGTWRLDPSRSTITDGAGIAGLIGAGAPPLLHITQPVNGTLIVESSVNEGHARYYVPEAKTATPVAQGGTIAMTSSRNGAVVIAAGTMSAADGSTTPVRERFSVDGPTLTIEVVAGADSKTSTFVYTTVPTVGPCEKWTTPCKR